MADASSLHCPNCGAAVQSEAGRCPFCRARLATVSCPACFALMFAGAAFCEKCGAKRARVADEGEGAHARCPGCKSELQRIAVGTMAMLECAACDGIWVDAQDFERLCADRDSQSAVLHRLSRREAAGASTRVQYRPCPRCGKMMNRVNFGKVSGTVVDVCKGHGTFLDAGELHQIVTFILDGGLERARERRLEEIRDEERKLLDERRKAAHERDRQSTTSTLGTRSVIDIADLVDLIGGN
ncbi:MAG TPA: zf-TFIIB domain-containing protein [Vicinamibacterales bacterium]|jgi:Zn-finger nucleic acid-binding protein